MSGHNLFTKLLQSYLAGKSTSEEHAELMRLIKSGKYDAILKQYIDDCLFEENKDLSIDDHRIQELLSRILDAEKHTARLIPVVSPMKRYRRLIAAIAAIVILGMATWWLVRENSPKQTLVAKKTAEVLHPVPDAKGKKYIRLKDGSTVLLNEGSHLEFPENFSAKSREVTLAGEAYFDIRPEESRPFIVHTGKVRTTVLGTAFNIKAYPAQKQVIVTVTRGKVQVRDENKDLGVIIPNESIAVNTDNSTYKQEKVDAQNIIEWKNRYLILDDISLQDAAALINSRYHVNISFSNETLKDCRISATFLNDENLEQVLTVITGVTNATYTLQPNDQVIISGDGCIN